jgi:nucleotide-binding universal stress UspA family protein
MMYKKVVVPLDGSRLAEAALPHLEEIAKGCSIPQVLLISVTELLKGEIDGRLVQRVEPFVSESHVAEGMPEVGETQWGVVFKSRAPDVQDIPARMGKMAKTASDYLCRIAEGLEAKGFNVTATVLLGHPAEQIVKYVNEQEADLIIMASTGKSKMSRWDMSHVAEKVIKGTRSPVLLVKPGPDFQETKPRRTGVAF